MENKVDVLVNAFADALSESGIVAAIQMAKISAMLSATRIEKGMTQKEFADFMGVSQGMVSKWESEEYNFTVANLAKICEKLNLTLEINLRPQWSNFKKIERFHSAGWEGTIAKENKNPMGVNGVA